MTNEYEIDFKQLLLIIKRQFRLIVAITSVFLLMAAVYCYLAVPQYTAQALLFMDKRTTEKTKDASSISPTGYDSQAIESEVGVLTSGRVAGNAIKILEDKGYLKDLQGKTEQEKLDQLLSGLKATRQGETYLLSIKYTAATPEEAADFANAFAQGYIEEQLGALSGMTTKTADWLQSKVEELRNNSIKAAQAVADYRSKYNSRIQAGAAKNSDDYSLVELNTLEKEADTYKNLHDDYLEKFRAATTQESFPITETRIITQALPPTDKSHPKTMLLIVASLIIGGGLGGLLALIRDNFDKSLRRAGQIKTQINVPFLGFLPNLNNKHKNLLADNDNDHSLDAYCTHETIQVICNAIDSKLSGADGTRVVGITSLMKDSGQTAIAARLSELASKVGQVALIRSAADPAHHGDVTTKTGNVTTIDVSASEADGFSSISRVEQMIQRLKGEYKYVIIDLPPLIAKADFYSFSRALDGLVIIAKWGKTLPNSLNFHLGQNNIDKKNVVGVVLEGTDLKNMQNHYGHKFRA